MRLQSISSMLGRGLVEQVGSRVVGASSSRRLRSLWRPAAYVRYGAVAIIEECTNKIVTEIQDLPEFLITNELVDVWICHRTSRL